MHRWITLSVQRVAVGQRQPGKISQVRGLSLIAGALPLDPFQEIDVADAGRFTVLGLGGAALESGRIFGHGGDAFRVVVPDSPAQGQVVGFPAHRPARPYRQCNGRVIV